MQSQPIAHIGVERTGVVATHDLAEHLKAVAVGAAEAAQAFGGDRWAHLAGLWHDLGKYRSGFQEYLRATVDENAHIEGRIASADKSHSAAGALHAIACLGQLGDQGEKAARVLAYLIAGHHAGLADWLNEDRRDLSFRLNSEAAQREHAEATGAAPPEVLQPGGPMPDLRVVPGGAAGFALWTRMLFSCLVDADFLDTERFMDGRRAGIRAGFPSITAMLHALNVHLEGIGARLAAGGLADTHVNRMRASVLRECREAGRLSPGFFSLEVPTGGGKTLSSLAFGLEHAAKHGKRRVIYAIPYTSIIEQTADVFRGVFESLGDVVVEHHSQAESDSTQETARSRIACENWDAPVVVTTNVQLFESLFAARTSRCRKLHNLVGSVIILDEAQQLPPEFLQPILDVLNLLVRHYSASVVLCTATQPALGSREYFDSSIRGIDSIQPIIQDPDALFRALKRVEIRFPADFRTRMQWADVASELAARDCVLAIVNTRRQARELVRLLPDGAVHLSNRMCGAHKSVVIDQIKQRLKARRDGTDNIPLRVVSTSLVEAGVDLDFPCVFRALAGLDSIAQAAGRCNREGQLPGMGEVVVYVPPEDSPPGLMRKGTDACISTLHGIAVDPLGREVFEPYFRAFYRAVDLDKFGINDLLRVDPDSLAVSFRTAAERFRLIDDSDNACVVVRYRTDEDDARVDQLLARLAQDGPKRCLLRALQRYTVSVREAEAQQLLARGTLVLAMPGLYVLQSDSLYHAELGLLEEDDVFNPRGNVA